MNHMIHIAAVTQVRLDTEGRASYRRKRAEGKKPMEAMRCLKRKALRRHLSPSPTSSAPVLRSVERVREGAAGRLKNPARSTCLAHRYFGSITSRTRTPDATRPPSRMRTPARRRLLADRADVPEPSRWSAPPDERP